MRATKGDFPIEKVSWTG